jgi:hypothetical protein
MTHLLGSGLILSSAYPRNSKLRRPHTRGQTRVARAKVNPGNGGYRMFFLFEIESDTEGTLEKNLAVRAYTAV